MPITFKCDCGRYLQAPDGTEGKRTQCPGCQKILTIPVPAQAPAQQSAPPPSEDAGTSPSEPPSPCPHCGEAMPAGAVLCVHCGYNAKTGQVTGAATPEAPAQGPEEDEEDAEAGRRPAVALPVKKFVGAGVALAVLAAGWFFVWKPLKASMARSNARAYLTNGDLGKALNAYRELRDGASGSDRDDYELRMKQIDLERRKNTGPTLSEGRTICPQHLEVILYNKGFSGGALMVEVNFKNKGEKPVTVAQDHFYLRGMSDIVLVAEHEENDMQGTVPPGTTKTGRLAFRKLPDHPAQRKLGRRTEKAYYMMFNDGRDYVKQMLPF